MASKTTLPIARLRALGCRIGTLPGHWPDAQRGPNWQYAITLPKGIELPISDRHSTIRGVASASVFRDGRIMVRAFSPGQSDAKLPRADRERIAGDVAAVLSAIADTLNGR